MVTTEQRRTVVSYVESSAELATLAGAPLSERRTCRYVGVHRALCRYVAQRLDDDALRERIKTFAAERPRWGVPRLVWRLHRDGWPDNHKPIERICREEGLAVRRRTKKRVARPRVIKPAVTLPNERWSMDFARDTLADGRVFRAFTLVDDCTRECPVIEVDTSLSRGRVVRVLDRVAIARGLPTSIACDNGPAGRLAMQGSRQSLSAGRSMPRRITAA